MQPFLNVAERAATEAGMVREAVDLGKSGLHESRGSSEESNEPHPEDGTRAAEGYGRGDAHDVSCAHTAGQRHAEGAE